MIRIAAAFALVLAAANVRVDAVLDWNEIALETTAAAPFAPPLETRTMALVHAAMFDAVNAYGRRYAPYRVDLVATGDSPAVAAAAAAHAVLVATYPDARAALDAALAAHAPGAGEDAAFGARVAAQLLASRREDGSAATRTLEALEEAGAWRPTPSGNLPAMAPHWAHVEPFVLHGAAQFRPGPPPALASAAYARDFAEVARLGSLESTERTPRQTAIARLWVRTAAQQWNVFARAASRARGDTLVENARHFALLNLAGADAFIAAWDAKYHYRQWRPVTAIRAADRDGNDATEANRDWTPLLATPPFPDYIAGHTTYAGTAARILAALYGDRPGITFVMEGEDGFKAEYDAFSEIAADCANARLWGGVHWRTSNEVGLEVGDRIGAFALRAVLAPRLAQP